MGTSVPVDDVWQYIDCGDSEENEIRRFLEAYPEVRREQLEAWLMSEELSSYEKEIRRRQDRGTSLAILGAIGAMLFLTLLGLWVLWNLWL